MSAAELASLARISKFALRKIERGATGMPRAETLSRISQALGVPLEALLDTSPNTCEDRMGELIGAMKPSRPANSPVRATGPHSGDRASELMDKFRLLLGSPMAEEVSRIIESSFRLLPTTVRPPGDKGSGCAPFNEGGPAAAGRLAYPALPSTYQSRAYPPADAEGAVGVRPGAVGVRPRFLFSGVKRNQV
jgi:transcriptional regulator with XRE-family HTH domain